MKRLPDTELEVMKALWTAGNHTSRGELEEALAPQGWAPTTINTYLTRLEKKAFVTVEHAPRGNLYSPRVSREAYLTFDSRAVLHQLYGTPRNFIAALARGGMNRQDVEQLRALLNELEDAHE